MSYVIRIIEVAGAQPPEDECVDGEYIANYDVDARDGRGEVATTKDITIALRFPSPAAAIKALRTQSSVRPLRDDGKPNRPLTAYTVQIFPA